MGLKKQKVAKSGQQSLTPADNKKLLKHITTKKNWNQLVIDRSIKLQLNHLTNLIPQLNIHGKSIEVKNDAESGYKVLFAGPTKGKKLAAKLIGKQNSLDVYRIDISRLVPNYNGETEKNLEKIFDAAEAKNWILFFDEADALFGKRTDVKDSHDRYANNEISYLLQKIKKYPGLIIFSSKNVEDNNHTFPIHFNTIIHFKKPS